MVFDGAGLEAEEAAEGRGGEVAEAVGELEHAWVTGAYFGRRRR